MISSTVLALFLSGASTPVAHTWANPQQCYYLYPGSFGILPYDIGHVFNSENEVRRFVQMASNKWKTYVGSNLEIKHCGDIDHDPIRYNFINEVGAIHCNGSAYCDGDEVAEVWPSWNPVTGERWESDLVVYAERKDEEGDWEPQQPFRTRGALVAQTRYLNFTLTHEFGHFMGMQHNTDITEPSVMHAADGQIYSWTSNPSNEDILAARGAYGTTSRRLCRMRGYFNTSGNYVNESLTGCDTGVGRNGVPSIEYSHVSPSIDNHLTTFEPDFYVAWTGTTRNINTKTGTHTSNGSTIYWDSKVVHSDTSLFSPSAAFGSNHVAFAYTGLDDGQTVNVKVAPKSELGNAASYHWHAFWNFGSSGPVSITYSQSRDRFVIVFVARLAGNIWYTTSAAGDPYTWSTPVPIPGDFHHVTWETPDIACKNYSTPSSYCTIAFRPTDDLFFRPYLMEVYLDSSGQLLYPQAETYARSSNPVSFGPSISFWVPIYGPPSGFLTSSTAIISWPFLATNPSSYENAQYIRSSIVYGNDSIISWNISGFPETAAHCRYSNRIEILYRE